MPEQIEQMMRQVSWAAWPRAGGQFLSQTQSSM